MILYCSISIDACFIKGFNINIVFLCSNSFSHIDTKLVPTLPRAAGGQKAVHVEDFPEY